MSIISVKSTRSVNIEAMSMLGAHKVRELSPSRTSILIPKDILLNDIKLNLRGIENY